MKANSNFKLSKTSKRIIATVVDSHQRGNIKRMMIDAEIHAAIQPRVSKNRKEDKAE